MAKLKRLYNPIKAAVSLETIGSQLIQEYDADKQIYTPDRRMIPVVVQPTFSIVDPAGLVPDGIVNDKLIPGDIKYFRTVQLTGELKEILSTDTRYKIDRASDNNNRGRITIYKNINPDDPETIIFEATYKDIVNGRVRRMVTVQESFVLTTNTAAQAPLVLQETYSRGRIFNPLKGYKKMGLAADLYSGEEIIPAAYWWYKKKPNGEFDLLTEHQGHNTREVIIPSHEIGDSQTYKVKVQDCREDLAKIRNEYYDNALGIVDGQEIPGMNLIENSNNIVVGTYPNSEITPEGWLKVSNQGTVANFLSNAGLDKKIANGEKVILSFKAKATGTTSPPTFYINSAFGYLKMNGTLSEDFSIFTLPVTWVSGGSEYFHMSLNKNGVYFFKDFKLEKGTKATDWTPAPEDIDLNEIQLPIGYRPETIRIDKETEMTLTTRYPEYDVRVVTDYGDSNSIINIPADVYEFEAWVEIHTSQGLLVNPSHYFEIDWGGGKIGERITVYSDFLGLDIYTLEPTVREKLAPLDYSPDGILSVTGVKILWLGANAGEGNATFNMKGLTATNLIENGDFRNGQGSWGVYLGTIVSVKNNVLTFLPDRSSAHLSRRLEVAIEDSVFYISAGVKTLSYNVGIHTEYMKRVAYTGEGNWQTLSHRFSVPAGRTIYVGISQFAADSFFEISVRDYKVINLTQTFGAGNELTKEWCDEHFPNYFEGTQSVDAPVRIKSVGKNLLPLNAGVWESGTLHTTGENISSSARRLRTIGYINAESNQDYYLSIYSDHKIFLMAYDTSGAYLGYLGSRLWQESSVLRKTPPNTARLRFVIAKNDDSTIGLSDLSYVKINLEKGTKVTTYEPYKESNLYIDNNIKLRSLPNGVKDEIRSDGKGGYEMVKRISEVDGSVLATPLITSLSTSGSLISRPSGTIYVENVVANAGVYTDKFSVVNANLKIKALESIITLDYTTGAETNIDISTAVISDTSFTHPDLSEGDIVFITYVYQYEGPWGESTIEYHKAKLVL